MLENGGEVCLEEEVERRRRSGMTPEEIAREMGVELTWVEEVVAMSPDEGSSGGDRSPNQG
jgi:predicted transposase YdaD